LGWLGKTVYQISGLLSSIDTRTLLISQRVDRIAKALPEMGKHIAWEEVFNPFLTAVITTKPFKKSGNLWVRNVYIIDTIENTLTTYEIPLNSPNDRRELYAIIGSAHQLEPTIATFKQ